MLFYKSSHRSNVPARPEHATNDHDNLIEDEGVTFQDDCYLEEIAKAANAEADTAARAAQSPAPNDKRLSPFESELLAAWSDK
jgi:hypothetical protein